MPLQVTADVAHPAAYLEDTFEIGNVIFRGTRVFLVTGLTTGSSTDAATLTARALLAAGIPILGQTHPDPTAASYGCYVKNRRTQTIHQSDDAVYVYIDYDTLIPDFGGGIGIISVERDSSLQPETVDLHPVDGQITINPPTGAPAGTVAVPGSVLSGFPLRKLVITAAVRPQNMDPVENAVGTVNDGNWFGKGTGYWKFDRIADVQQLGSGTIAVVTEFSTRNFRNWNAFDVRKSEAYGQNIRLDNSTVQSAIAAPYKYGITRFSGITVVGNFPLISFGSLFGITHYPP